MGFSFPSPNICLRYTTVNRWAILLSLGKRALSLKKQKVEAENEAGYDGEFVLGTNTELPGLGGDFILVVVFLRFYAHP